MRLLFLSFLILSSCSFANAKNRLPLPAPGTRLALIEQNATEQNFDLLNSLGDKYWGNGALLSRICLSRSGTHTQITLQGAMPPDSGLTRMYLVIGEIDASGQVLWYPQGDSQ